MERLGGAGASGSGRAATPAAGKTGKKLIAAGGTAAGWGGGEHGLYKLALEKLRWNGSIFANMKAEGIVIRRARPNENNSVHALVQVIANETFAHLFACSQAPIGEPNWLSAWVALSGGEIVGVTSTEDGWVNDLWVRSDSRRVGIGARLLAQAELEICGRGHKTFRLRVVKSNIRAVQFYESQGWRVRCEFPHEKFGHPMFEMNKSEPRILMP